jgi:hypothetical protein
MQDKTKRFQCRHIFTEGRRCGSPSLRGEDFCYYHHTTRRPTPNPRTREDRYAFDLPLPEDRGAIQLAIGQILLRIAHNQIDSKRAGLLLYGLQIASANLPRQNPKDIRPSPQVEEITNHPDLGLLAPPAEYDENTISGRSTFLRDILENLRKPSRDDKEEATSSTTPNASDRAKAILPTLQATVETASTHSMSRRRPTCRNQRSPLFQAIKPIRSHILKDLRATIRPQHLHLVDSARRAEPKVQSQIALREVAPTAPHLSKLLHLSHGHSHASIQSQPIHRTALKVEADPVIRRIALSLKNHRRSGQIFNNNVQPSAVEQIANRQPPTHLRRSNRTACLRADILEGPVALVLKNKLRLAISSAKLGVIDLRINVPIHENQVQPA